MLDYKFVERRLYFGVKIIRSPNDKCTICFCCRFAVEYIVLVSGAVLDLIRNARGGISDPTMAHVFPELFN